MSLLSLGTALLFGCASAPDRELSVEPATYAMLPNGNDPLNVGEVAPSYVQFQGEGGESKIRAFERLKGRPLNILSLSGGGQNGAFGAGFLAGWRESGTRPEFDAVGGVSTGALLATHALLGTPEDDEILGNLYTGITSDDIFWQRSIFGLLSADSLMDTAPLRELIEGCITAETLERVAAAADDRRFLFVGTTNVDYDQTWIWNMSDIARAGDLELYRKVLLASASFPIVFPPVEIDGHLFVDGAARSNLVVPGLSGPVMPGPPLHGPGNIYVIDNGKLWHRPAAQRRALGDIATTTIGVMMNQSMQTAILRCYAGARAIGYNFKMVAIPPEVRIGKDPLAFDPDKMQAAFDAGRALGSKGDAWSSECPQFNDLPAWAVDLIDERR